MFAPFNRAGADRRGRVLSTTKGIPASLGDGEKLLEIDHVEPGVADGLDEPGAGVGPTSAKCLEFGAR